MTDEIYRAQRNAAEAAVSEKLARMVLVAAAKPEPSAPSDAQEPVFILRAQDACADEVVQRWIDLNVGRLGFDHPTIASAMAVRDAMAAWPSRKNAD